MSREELKEAIAIYKQAQKLDPEIDLNPDPETIDQDPFGVTKNQLD